MLLPQTSMLLSSLNYITKSIDKNKLGGCGCEGCQRKLDDLYGKLSVKDVIHVSLKVF